MKLVGVALFALFLGACAESQGPKAATSDSATPVLAAPSAPMPPAPSATASASATPRDTSAPPAGPCTNRDPERTATSPDGRVTVFVAVDGSESVATTTGDLPRESLCVSRDGAAPRILVAGHEAGPHEGVERTLAGFGQLVLSPDGALLFFTSAAWMTSNAAHVVDIATGKEKFLFDGGVEAAIVSGRDKGHYLAGHFRLDDAHPIASPQYRGRIPSWSVVSKEGKTIRKLSDAEARRIARSETAATGDVGPED